MSGLCGWFSHEADTPPRAAIDAMAAALGGDAPARGGRHALGRVAILAAPAQAALHQDEDLLIACWGERPAALADTLARSWRVQGAGACAALAGAFAVALFDRSCGEGLLAVDRCASRPLFYQSVGRSLLFATSSTALACASGTGMLDPQAIFDYLYLGGCGPRSMFGGQRRLAPGECLHLHGGRAERARYWHMRFTEHAEGPVPHIELVDSLSSALARPGKCEGMGDAGLLSAGGPASALLAAMLGRCDTSPVHTYALGFGAHDREALARIRAVSRRIGSRHREREVGPDEIEAAVAVLARKADAPCGDPLAVTMLLGAEVAREDKLGRLYSAAGAAQLFGRGACHAALAHAGRYQRLPGPLRQLLLDPVLCALGARLPGAAARLRTRIEDSLAPGPVRLRRHNRLLRQGLAAVFEPAFLESVDPEAPGAALEQAWWAAQARSPVNRAIAMELGGELPVRVLPAFASACAAAGVLPLLPYLDDAVVAMAARLAPRYKDERRARRLFARALAEAGTAHGLAGPGAPAPPIGRWLMEEPRLRALAGDSLSDLARRQILRRDFLDLLLARRLPEDTRTHGATVWQLMMLERWLAQHPASACTHEDTGEDLLAVAG